MGDNIGLGSDFHDWIFVRPTTQSILKMVKGKKIVFSVICIVAGLAVAAFVSYKASKEMKRSSQIEEEINVLRREAEKIRSDNQNMKERIAYFETREFQEREAKEKLNFQKEGEKVVVVRPSQFQEIKDGGDVQGGESAKTEEAIPNYKKWLNYFFKY